MFRILIKNSKIMMNIHRPCFLCLKNCSTMAQWSRWLDLSPAAGACRPHLRTEQEGENTIEAMGACKRAREACARSHVRAERERDIVTIWEKREKIWLCSRLVCSTVCSACALQQRTALWACSTFRRSVLIIIKYDPLFSNNTLSAWLRLPNSSYRERRP